MRHDSDDLGGWNQVGEGTKGGSNEWRQVRSSEDANRLGHVRVAPTGVDEAAVTLAGTRTLRVWVLGGGGVGGAELLCHSISCLLRLSKVG